MDWLEKVKIYAQLLLEVINEIEIKKQTEREKATIEKEQKMLIDLSGISVSTKPRKDGRYQGYYTHNGKKYYVYGKTEQEVKTKIEVYIKTGEVKKKKAFTQKKATLTMSEWLRKWIQLYKKPNLKPITLEHMNASLKVVHEKLGDKNLQGITAEDLQQLLIGIKGERSRQLLRGYLDQTFKKAVLCGQITRNPCDALELKKHRPEQRHALTTEEQAEFIKAIEDLKMKPLLLVLLTTGLRIGEALALKYGDFNFEQSTVSINKNVVFIRGERIEQDSTKSIAGMRTIPVLPNVLAMFDSAAEKESPVFPFTYSAVRNTFRTINQRLGFNVSPHILRHTYATRLEEAGISPKLKQYLLGHSSITMTQNTYTDVQQGYVKEKTPSIYRAFDI